MITLTDEWMMKLQIGPKLWRRKDLNTKEAKMGAANIMRHLELLGLRATDKVTGVKGVVTSVAFDLYGCIQALITPSAGKEGKFESSYWFDIQRLNITSKKPVMEVPNFDKNYVSEGHKGPAAKPDWPRR